jgi:hypothetical protein
VLGAVLLDITVLAIVLLDITVLAIVLLDIMVFGVGLLNITVLAIVLLDIIVFGVGLLNIMAFVTGLLGITAFVGFAATASMRHALIPVMAGWGGNVSEMAGLLVGLLAAMQVPDALDDVPVDGVARLDGLLDVLEVVKDGLAEDGSDKGECEEELHRLDVRGHVSRPLTSYAPVGVSIGGGRPDQWKLMPSHFIGLGKL